MKGAAIGSLPFFGCVAKTRRGTQGQGGSPFLLGLGRHPKEAGDEGDLPSDVSFAHPVWITLIMKLHAPQATETN
jgi:hypothetical protein